MRLDPPSPSDRRSDFGLLFVPEKGLLMLGEHAETLDAGWTNQQVLTAFVRLAGQCRGDRVESLVEVRQADVDALARALDLDDAEELIPQIEAALGATREEAARLVAKLREYRLIGGIAAAATGAALAGALVIGGIGGHDPAPPTTPHMAAAPRAEAPTTTTHSSTAPDPSSIETTPEGVGLVPAIQQDAHGTGLIAPASTDAPPAH
jgi:hypothetical protein